MARFESDPRPFWCMSSPLSFSSRSNKGKNPQKRTITRLLSAYFSLQLNRCPATITSLSVEGFTCRSRRFWKDSKFKKKHKASRLQYCRFIFPSLMLSSVNSPVPCYPSATFTSGCCLCPRSVCIWSTTLLQS